MQRATNYSVSHISRVPDEDTGRRLADALQSRLPSRRIMFAVLKDNDGWRVVANYHDVKPVRLVKAIRFAEDFLKERTNIWRNE